MIRSSKIMTSAMGLMGLLLAAALGADEPAKKATAVKPQWQRLLQGEDAKKAEEQEEKLAQLQEAGKFMEALKIAQTLADFRARVQGADHWETVDARSELETVRRMTKAKKEEQEAFQYALAMERQAATLFAEGRYSAAQPLWELILAIHRKVLGEEHPATATSYNKVANNLHGQGKHKEAEEAYRKALAIRRKVLGEEHPETGNSYNNLAVIQNAQDKYREAEEGFRKALAIFRKAMGEEHPSAVRCYSNVAVTLNAQGRYQEAEESYRKALAIFRQALGEEHPDTARCYHNLAKSQEAQGRYKEAEESYRKALAIYRKTLGEEHPYTARCYDNLAVNLNTQGAFKEAEEGLRKALAIRRKVQGEEHPDTAASYNNLAANLYTQRKYPEAEEHSHKALVIHRKVLGEEDPDTANSYNNLALILFAQGKHQEAAALHQKALVIRRKVRGEEHPDTAASYNNLAANQSAQGKNQEAEEGYRKALIIYRKVLGEEHPRAARCYNNVAGSLHAQGKYREAEEGVRKALAIYRKSLGEEHPDTADSYNNAALNLNARGKYQEAEEYWLFAADAFAKARLYIAATGLERAAFSHERSPLPALAAVLARNGKPTDAWQRFEESLARGTWDDVTARLRRPQSERDKQAQITARIDRLQQLIERVSVANTPLEQARQREEWLGQLHQAYDELVSFTQQLEKNYGPIAGQVFSRAKIEASLSGEAALLGWLDIPGQPKAADPNGEHWAVLLRASGDPVWVRLHGSGDKQAWTDADTQLPSQLRTALQLTRSKWQPLAQRLRQQRLQPLAQHLKGVRHLIVLPSTALAGVPIEVIAGGYTISYAHSGTMYAHLRQQPKPTTKGLLALADPIFESPADVDKPQPVPHGGVLLTMVAPGSNAFRAGLRANDVLLRYGDTDLNGPADFKTLPETPDSDKNVPVIVWRDGRTRKQPFYVRPGKLGVVVAKEPAPQALAEQRRLDHLLASRAGDNGKWNRLPGTRVEAAALQRLFGSGPVQVLLDSEASEQRLDDLAKSDALGKYRYVHLATHGEVNDTFPLRSAVILSHDRLPDEKQRTDLLVSGQPIPDGRLSAEEVLRHWNLNADLVTLSACETALGKYERGEGFVGFAQALVLSGSRSVCLSLWKVSDAATALLMERFYQNLLGKREGLDKPMSKAAALAEAKTWLRTLPRTEAVKRAASLSNGMDRGKRPALPPLQIAPAPGATAKDDRPFAHPYYWAAFVLVGHAD